MELGKTILILFVIITNIGIGKIKNIQPPLHDLGF